MSTNNTTTTRTPGRHAFIPGDLIDDLADYHAARAEASDAEDSGEMPDWAAVEDTAADLVDRLDDRIDPIPVRDHLGDDAARDSQGVATAVLTVGNLVDDEHLDGLVDAINGVGYASSVCVLRDGEADPVEINGTASLVVDGGAPRTVGGLHFDYSDDTPGCVQVEVPGEVEGYEPLYAYLTAADLRKLSLFAGALATKVEQRQQRLDGEEL
jgi:hypothetical protein